ncbi:MAG: BatA domain-containing protein, partial [Pirellulaceae bacterium]|nr:BatA domain-containing protein [Pirellulaceae bacterium]
MFGFSLTTAGFLIAGALCALGPIIIHLLNRRRFKVVQWAAMDFLREAMQRNRRIMQIRDILLLVLRTAAVFFFGLALAQPFFSQRREGLNEHQPVHAILVVDNSLSMDYGTATEGTGLTRAKEKAKTLIDKLPAGSKISVIPACGSREGYSPDPYDTKENALEALEKIEIVDRSATVLKAVNEAKKACEAAPELAKRIIFISDQQESNWKDLTSPETLKDLPAMQVVDVSLPNPKNAWIADLRVQDGLADVETPSTIVVQVEYSGLDARRDVPVKLYLGESVIGEKLALLEPGEGTREVDFEYTFNALSEMPEPGKPVFVTLKATIDQDELPSDDQRFLAVPVVAALPVVFVDQYGAEDEDPARNRLGETIRLRKLLAPKAAREEAPRQVVKIKHVRADELTQDVLADARLVVVAGLANIDDVNTVPMLRDYVKQGGQLLIAAGADFNPGAWDAAAWKDGEGILPAPLKRDVIGEVPEAAGENLKPFFLSFESLSGDEFFQLAGMPENDLRDLYSEPFFFKAVEADMSRETLDAWKETQRKKLGDELTFVAAAEKRKADRDTKTAGGALTEEDRKQQVEDETRLKELRPTWLTWASATSAATIESEIPLDDVARLARIGQLVEQQMPRVLAKFSDEKGSPFLVQRKIGRGNVIFCASGLSSNWNTMLTTNATVVFDRILRSMIQSTLPRRNYGVQERLTLPLLTEDHDLTVSLSRPGDAPPEPLDIGYIGKEQRGVTVSGMYQRGAYRVSAYRGQPASVDPSLPTVSDKPVWEIPLVVNGDAEESRLSPLSREKFEERASGTNLGWVGVGEDISLAGATIQGQNWWWYLVLFVFGCLLLEMGILAWPSVRPREDIGERPALAGR